jgi:hypothetical protein
VAASIPVWIIVIFHLRNTSKRGMTLGSTQLLTEMSNKNISWPVKAAGAEGLQPYHFHVATDGNL